MNVAQTFSNLLQQTAFFSMTWGNVVMILVAFIYLYLAIAKGFEPLLLVPISFGMLLVNIYPDIMVDPADTMNGTGGLLWYFFHMDELTILPSLIFMGVGAQTDFTADCKPDHLPAGSSCTVWYLCSILPGNFHGLQWCCSRSHFYHRRR